MFKRSLKYLSIILINLLVLTIMLMIWTDELELKFNALIVPTEVLKLIGISILGIIILGNAVLVFRKFEINTFKKRIWISTMLVLLTSTYFYVDYAKKIYINRIVNGSLRDGIIKKLSPVTDGLGLGTKAENLSSKEYAEITEISWFPKLPKNAENINYKYDYEAFLDDYSFSLSYDLPKTSKVDTLNYKDGSFTKKRSFKVIGEKIRVTYYELQL